MRKGLTEELKLKRRKKLRNESVSSNATLARHQKQNPAGLHSTSLNKLRSLKKLPSNCKASIKKQTYQRVDYIPEGRGACLHQAKEMLSLRASKLKGKARKRKPQEKVPKGRAD